jgi:hypothetical protein
LKKKKGGIKAIVFVKKKILDSKIKRFFIDGRLSLTYDFFTTGSSSICRKMPSQSGPAESSGFMKKLSLTSESSRTLGRSLLPPDG